LCQVHANNSFIGHVRLMTSSIRQRTKQRHTANSRALISLFN